MLTDMLPEVRSLFALADTGRGEVLVPLLEGGGFRLEQIVSFGAGSDPGFWYDQEQPEWVVLVRGTAVLEFEAGRLDLTGGDALLIPQRLRHRVMRTSRDAVWLALHFEASGADEAKTV
ncbi:MAG: hypothetical protein RI897_73 [Verrucomicrobiota bacterium]|jgi:cupin 2 domain-containing protein